MKLDDFVKRLREDVDPEVPLRFYDVQMPTLSVDGAQGARVKVEVDGRARNKLDKSGNPAELAANVFVKLIKDASFPTGRVTITVTSDVDEQPLYASGLLAAIEDKASGYGDCPLKVSLFDGRTGLSRMCVSDPLWGSVSVHAGNRLALSDGGFGSYEEAARAWRQTDDMRTTVVERAKSGYYQRPQPTRDGLRRLRALLDRASGLKEVPR